MEALEKLYFGKGDKSLLNIYSAKEPGDDIEYICTDTFMKRAKEAFCKARCNGHPPRSTCTSLGMCKEYDNFIKLMKGEQYGLQ